MTTHLDTSLRILGFPVAKLKALLTSWERTGKDPQELSSLAGVSLSPGSTAALLGEAWRLGLIGFREPEWPEGVPTKRVALTESGEALVIATSRPRTSKEKASKVLEQVLSRAQDLLDDPKAPVKPDRIWVFGSYVKPDKADVGDIDLVIESSRTGIVEYDQMSTYINANYPGLLPSRYDTFRWGAGELFRDRKLFGQRRHALLAPNDIGILVGMHEPCALFFDASRGGMIEPEFYSHHPESKGRASSMRERLVMPDLDGAARFELTNPIVVDGAFSKGRRESAFYAMDHIIREDGDSFMLRWSSDPDDGVTVNRTVLFEDDLWFCTYSIVPHSGVRKDDPHAWDSLARRIVLLAEADLLRLAVHRDDLGAMQEIEMDITLDEGFGTNHKLHSELDEHASRTPARLNRSDRPSFPERMSFGVMLLHEGSGGGICRPCDLTDEEWEEKSFPFTRADYEAWAEEFGVESSI